MGEFRDPRRSRGKHEGDERRTHNPGGAAEPQSRTVERRKPRRGAVPRKPG